MPLLAEAPVRKGAPTSGAPALLDFTLPSHLEAGEPPEARGLPRDQVRMLVSWYRTGELAHASFSDLPEFLQPGDVLVVNTSGTLKAALAARRRDDELLELHLSTRLPAGLWIVELRLPAGDATDPYLHASAGDELHLPAGARAKLLLPYDPSLRQGDLPALPSIRLWVAALDLPGPVEEYLDEFGFPIRYRYVRDSWPIAYYQTVYATDPGSAEMPSAGRAFTPHLITRLVAQGVHILPLLLHTGVASLEDGELPHEEFFRVPAETARAINSARKIGKKVIAVGTTTLRALETVAQPDGMVFPGEGWTDLVIAPHQDLHAVDALLTGFHEPKSSHLSILVALAGLEHVKETYAAALQEGYLWHEFGDLHLILP